MIVTVEPPTLPPSWETQGWDHHRWVQWALEYGSTYADLCEQEDQRLGLLPALSRAARRRRVAAAATKALRYRNEVQS